MQEQRLPPPGDVSIKRFVFTRNNYTDNDCTNLRLYIEKNAVFGVIGKEVAPTTGTRHLQGFIHLRRPRKWGTIQRSLAGCFIERAVGTDEQNLVYCSKTDTEAFVFGRPMCQGKRTDLDEIKEAIREGKSKFQLMDQFSTVFSAHQRFVEAYINEYANSQKPVEEIEKFRPWQQEIIEMVGLEPDDRHIIWVYDPEGGIGKTRLARWLVDNYNAFYTNGGRSIDITYSYNHQHIVIFDFVREAEEFISYSTIEQLKNGLLSSNKYQSCVKRFTPPHVLVFANFEPAPHKFSRDRVRLIRPKL